MVLTKKSKAILKKEKMNLTKGGNMKFKSYLYGAYGSNLNLGQMSLRCPKAEPVGSLMLHGWELKFRGVADIEEVEGGTVPIGLWRITQACESALDVYEGYPHLYTKKICTVKGMKEELGTDSVMLYMMQRSEVHPPSMPYLDCIMQGYEDFGLDVDYLRFAIKDAYAKEEATITPKPKQKRLPFKLVSKK